MGTINTKKLDKIFDLKTEDGMTSAVSTLQNELENINDEMLNTNEFLQRNYNSAINILQKVEEEMENGVFNDRLVNAAASLINTITTICNSMASSYISIETLDLKKESLDLKRREVEIKEAIKSASNGNKTQIQTQNNMIVTDRESILKMINSGVDIKTD